MDASNLLLFKQKCSRGQHGGKDDSFNRKRNNNPLLLFSGFFVISGTIPFACSVNVEANATSFIS
jgi:hypothetical protein